VEIEECWITTESSRVVVMIRPVVKSTHTSDKKIAVVTRGLALQNPTSVSSIAFSEFRIKYYSWENITEPTLSPIANDLYCFLLHYGITTTMSFTNNPSGHAEPTYTYINYPHQRFY